MNIETVAPTADIPNPGLTQEETRKLLRKMLSDSGGYLTEAAIKDELDRRYGKYASCGMQVAWRLKEMEEADLLTRKWDGQFRVYHVRLIAK